MPASEKDEHSCRAKMESAILRYLIADEFLFNSIIYFFKISGG